MTNPGDRIRSLRKGMGRKVTQAEVARAAGCSVQHLSMIENNKYLPGRSTLAAISEFFGVTIDYIVRGDTPAHQPQAGYIVNDPDELAWLMLWRGLTDDERRAMLIMLSRPRR